MSDQITNNPEALRLFFTEDIFLVDATQKAPAPLKSEELPTEASAPAAPEQTTLAAKPATAAAQATAEIPELKIPEISLPTAADPVRVETEAVEPVAHKQHFQYVGANQKQILILVDDALHPVSTLKGRELLGNILKAINLSRNDCALVNYASCSGADFTMLADFFQPRFLFSFGVLPAQLGLPEAAQNSIVQQEACKIIFSSNLDPLSDDPAIKKQLWTSLKQINL